MPRLEPHEEGFNDALLSIAGSHSQRLLHRYLDSILHTKLQDKSVLEAGCGGGSYTRRILRHNPRQLLACDLSPGALRKVQQLEDKRITLMRADLKDKLPIATSSLDVVLCTSVLMHLALNESADVLREFARVLRAEGLLVLAVLHEGYAATQYPSAQGFGETARTVIPAKSNSAGLQTEAALIEFYPPAAHYREALSKAGMKCSEEEVRESAAAEALWRVFLASKK